MRISCTYEKVTPRGADTIVAVAETEGVEILVMGANGNSTSNPGIGGTADQVSTLAPCTVMVVK